jgi:DNA polymerase-1
MIDVHQKLKGREDVRLLLQVHDELVFEASPKSKEELSSIIVSTMEQTVKLKVPLTVSVGSGKNWEEAH